MPERAGTEKTVVKVIRLRELMDKLGGVSKTTVYRMVERGDLPAPFKLGGDGSRAVGWLVSAVDVSIMEMAGRCNLTN